MHGGTGLSTAISVSGVSKRFRVPLDHSTTIKYRIVHMRTASRYRDFHALDDISFDVPAGQFIGIIGHNGSGKSTLLKLLARIYRQDAGRITINGRVSSFLELGVGFNGELTARENIFLGGAVLGLTRKELEGQVDDILAFAELEHVAEQKVKNFSSGMELRLAFAVAIRAEANILLMDEVLAVGDARFQEKCLGVFTRYRREGKTVVLVTHDLGTVQAYCDRAILLDHGKVIADGSPGEVVKQYRSEVGHQIDADKMAEKEGVAAQEAEPAGPANHWGSGELHIDRVRFLDSAGKEHYSFVSGGPMDVVIDVGADAEVDQLICGISFHRNDGFIIAGTNTMIHGMRLASPRAGEAIRFVYHLDELTLLGGTYRVTIDISSRETLEAYAHHDQDYEFHVTDESGRIGIVELGGRWDVQEPPAAAVASRSMAS